MNRIIKNIVYHFPFLLSDKKFIEYMFELRMGYKLDLKNPRTFNEKLQYLKLYDHNDVYTAMVDKYEAKKIIAEKIGEDYVIPTIGVWGKADEIDWNALPDSFVIKCNHDCGSTIVCTDKTRANEAEIKNRLSKSLKRDYYIENREWPYKNVRRRILAEEFIGKNLRDYRVYCFNGKAKYIYSYTNVEEVENSKPEPVSCDIFDTDWERADFRQKCPPGQNVDKPNNLATMIQCAEKLSAGVPFLRVDFYNYENTLKVGELTFYPGSGFSKFIPESKDLELGQLISSQR